MIYPGNVGLNTTAAQVAPSGGGGGREEVPQSARPNQDGSASVYMSEKGGEVSKDQEFTEFAHGSRLRLWRLACLLVLDQHEAEDLVQDAFERTYRAWRRIRQQDNAESYARRILVRLAIDRGRQRKTQLAAHMGVQETAPAVDAMAQVDDWHELAPAIRALAPGQRQCLVLRFYADLPVSEIADLLGCSEGTVKSQTHDALANLRRHSNRETGSTP